MDEQNQTDGSNGGQSAGHLPLARNALIAGAVSLIINPAGVVGLIALLCGVVGLASLFSDKKTIAAAEPNRAKHVLFAVAGIALGIAGTVFRVIAMVEHFGRK